MDPSVKSDIQMKKRPLTAMDKCEDTLLQKLRQLKEMKILNHSLTPKDKASDFEILEFYGDAVMLERISHHLLQSKRFMNPGLLTKMRQACICNVNLINCYDKLELVKLLDNHIVLVAKEKADLLEAVIGELAEALKDQSAYATHHSKIKTIMEQLIGFIQFSGEQTFTLENPSLQVSPSKVRSVENPPSVTSPKRNEESKRLSPKKEKPTEKIIHTEQKKVEPKQTKPKVEQPQQGQVKILQRPATTEPVNTLSKSPKKVRFEDDQSKDLTLDWNTLLDTQEEVTWEKLVEWSSVVPCNT